MKNLIILLSATLIATSAYANNGYEAPIYLSYGVQSSHQGTAVKMGRTLENGVFEPGYLSYQFDPSPTDLDTLLREAPPAAGKMKETKKVAGYVEPIYIDYTE